MIRHICKIPIIGLVYIDKWNGTTARSLCFHRSAINLGAGPYTWTSGADTGFSEGGGGWRPGGTAKGGGGSPDRPCRRKITIWTQTNFSYKGGGVITPVTPPPPGSATELPVRDVENKTVRSVECSLGSGDVISADVTLSNGVQYRLEILFPYSLSTIVRGLSSNYCPTSKTGINRSIWPCNLKSGRWYDVFLNNRW